MTSNRYQMHDAAFIYKNGSKFNIYIEVQKRSEVDKFSNLNPKFNDKQDYKNKEMPELGVKIPNLGLQIKILKQ